MTTGSPTTGSIGVVYLARSADGLAALRRFADSYHKQPAGLTHDLVVVYKGFMQRGELEEARQQFAGSPHIGIELNDSGFDIGSYLETCRRVSHNHLFFLNTHSELVNSGWLAHVSAYGTNEGCGIAGTMGSYESLFDTVGFLENVIKRSLTATGELGRQLAYYFDFLLPRFRPDWYGGTRDDKLRHGVLDYIKGLLRGRPKESASGLFGELRGTALIWPGAPEIDISQFPPFPNPHIRSNGFMVERNRFLSCGVTNIESKSDANLFESGKASLTAQLRRRGLTVIVVGADGHGYSIDNWWRSGTFRLERQQNLLVSDNHTRAFSSMSEGAQIAHSRMTWGDFLRPAPDDFPDFGFRFGKGALVPA